MKLPSLHRHLGAALALSILAVGCGSDAGDDSLPEQASPNTEASRDDIDCSPEALGENDSTEFLVAHTVVDGELGAVCLGQEDESLLDAWQLLSDITPPEQLNDLFVFAGFKFNASGDNETAAFVNVVDDEGSGFQMSINLDAYDADPNEAALTVAHEFSHVVNNTENQIDRSVQSAEVCNTYYNTEGCYLPDSVMAQWIETFWGDGLIDEIDVTSDPDPQAGEQRCSNDDRFLGPYAASNPEEDFGETFSAFVFQVSPVSDGVQTKFDWLADQPGLVEFQQRAQQASLGPLDNQFERCG